MDPIKLKNLLEEAFIQGAHSHDNRSVQYDTCWSNVHDDCKEYVLTIIDNLDKQEVIN